MENNKKNLAKKAFAALILAASLPVAGHAAGSIETTGTLLAGGCGGSGGCAASRSSCSQKQGSCSAAPSKSFYNRNSYNNDTHTCAAATSSGSPQAPAAPNAQANPYNTNNSPNRPSNPDAMNGAPGGYNYYNKPAPVNPNASAGYNTGYENTPAAPQRGNNMNNWNR